MTTAGPASLEVRDLTVRFAGLVANDAVSLSVRAGSISALIGPNGAGKTTLFNAITGVIRPSSGRLELDGHDVSSLPTTRRAALGVARTFQNLLLVPTLSALDNVVVGAARMRTAHGLTGRLRIGRATLERIAREALDFAGVAHRADDPVHVLPFGDRRRVELARSLASAPRLLLLDEPASGLPHDETSELIDIIRRVRDELATTVLVVEHDMSFVRAIAEETVVLDFGRVLASGVTTDVLADERVIDAYLGGGGSGRGSTPSDGGTKPGTRRPRPLRAPTADARVGRKREVTT